MKEQTERAIPIRKFINITFGILVPFIFIVYIAPFHNVDSFGKMNMIEEATSIGKNPAKVFVAKEQWHGNIPSKYLRFTEKILVFSLSFIRDIDLVIILNIILAILFIALVNNIYHLTNISFGHPSGILAVFLFITSPLVYYHFYEGSIATYLELFFLTGGIYYFIKGRYEGNKKYTYLGLFLVILAIFSKEPALFILPPLIFAVAFILKKPEQGKEIKVNKILLTVFFLTVCLAILSPFTIRQTVYIIRNLKNVLLSANLYLHNYINGLLVSYYGWLLLILGISIFFKKTYKEPNVKFYVIWFFVAFMPLLFWNFYDDRHLANAIIPIVILSADLIARPISCLVRNVLSREKTGSLRKNIASVIMIITLIFAALFNFINFSPTISDIRRTNLEWKNFWDKLKHELGLLKTPFKVVIIGHDQYRNLFWSWRVEYLRHSTSTSIKIVDLRFSQEILDHLIKNAGMTQNLVINGGFEDGKTGWDGFDSRISISDKGATEGSYCVMIKRDKGPVENIAYFRQSIRVKPEKLYLFGGYIKTINLFTTGRIEVQDVNGYHISYGLTNEYCYNAGWSKAFGVIFTGKSTNKVWFIPLRIPNYISGVMQVDSLFFVEAKSDKFLMLPGNKSVLYFYQ